MEFIFRVKWDIFSLSWSHASKSASLPFVCYCTHLSKSDLKTAQLCVIYRTWCVISEHKECSVLHRGYNAVNSDELKAFGRVWKSQAENQPWGNGPLLIFINTLLSSLYTMKGEKGKNIPFLYDYHCCLSQLVRFPFVLQYMIQL